MQSNAENESKSNTCKELKYVLFSIGACS